MQGLQNARHGPVRRVLICNDIKSENIARGNTTTGVHGRDELHARRKIGLLRGARNRDGLALERLAEDLEHAPVELGQLVQEQDPVMGKRDLTRPGLAATAHQDHGGGRVMGRAKRPPAECSNL